ncbi:MAG: AAA family ATPase [Bacteroidia bacterium]|nr:AAA family ATPase [Bacteroidia bacterium]
MIIVVFGLPGSGKSYFAQHLARLLNAAYLSSDRIRREILEIRSYEASEKHRVYKEMFNRIPFALEHSKYVILDASFSQKSTRKLLENISMQLGQEVSYIEIKADEEIIRERVAKKRPFSEADFAVYEKVKKLFDPLTEEHLILESKRDNLQEMLAISIDYLSLNHEAAAH